MEVAFPNARNIQNSSMLDISPNEQTHVIFRVPSLPVDCLFEASKKVSGKGADEIHKSVDRFVQVASFNLLPLLEGYVAGPAKTLQRYANRNFSGKTLKKLCPLWRYFVRATSKATVEGRLCGIGVANVESGPTTILLGAAYDKITLNPFLRWQKLLTLKESVSVQCEDLLFLNPSLGRSSSSKITWWDLSGSGDLILRSTCLPPPVAALVSSISKKFCPGEIFQVVDLPREIQVESPSVIACLSWLVQVGILMPDAIDPIEHAIQSTMSLRSEQLQENENTLSESEGKSFRLKVIDRGFILDGIFSSETLSDIKAEVNSFVSHFSALGLHKQNRVRSAIDRFLEYNFAGCKVITIQELEQVVVSIPLDEIVEKFGSILSHPLPLRKIEAQFENWKNNSCAGECKWSDVFNYQLETTPDSAYHPYPLGYEASVRLSARGRRELDLGNYLIAPEMISTPGALISRFSHLIDPKICNAATERYCDRIQRYFPNSIVAELALQRVSPQMAVSRHRSVDRYLFEPFCFRASRNRGRVICRDEMLLKRDQNSNTFRLYNNNRVCFLLYRSLHYYPNNTLFHILMNIGAPQLEPHLGHFSFQTKSIMNVVQPRIQFGRVVVSPSRLRLNSAFFMENNHNTSIQRCADRVKILNKVKLQYGIPQFCFYFTEKVKKPQLLDFHSPLSADSFFRDINRYPVEWVELVEMIPSPDFTWLHDICGKKYVSELILDF